MLPPVPANVWHLIQDVDILGLQCTIGFWLFGEANDFADPSFIEGFFSQYFTSCQPPILGLMHNQARLTTCRLRGRGVNFVANSPDNHGAWNGATAAQVASGLKWTLPDRGRRSWSITYMPACPANFIDDHWRLSETGYGSLRDLGLELLFALNALPASLGGNQLVGTVRRKTAAGPRAVAQFDSFRSVFPVVKVATCGRRIPDRGHLSPFP